MTLEELKTELERVENIRKEMGDDPGEGQMLLTLTRSDSPRSDRVRIAPGLFGRFCSEERLTSTSIKVMVWVKAKDMRKWLEDRYG